MTDTGDTAYSRAALAGFAAGYVPPVIIGAPSVADPPCLIALDGSLAVVVRPARFTAGYWEVVARRPGCAGSATVVKTLAYAKRLARQKIGRRNDLRLWPHRN